MLWIDGRRYNVSLSKKSLAHSHTFPDPIISSILEVMPESNADILCGLVLQHRTPVVVDGSDDAAQTTLKVSLEFTTAIK